MQLILVIDDDDLMRDTIMQMLDIEGFSFKGVANGFEAIKLIENFDFDLVITDLIMPEKEGLETIIYLKKKKPNLPIIAISGGARIGPESYLILAKQLGAKFTLAKPFRRNELISAVKDCLQMS